MSAAASADTFVDAYALLGLPRDASHGAIKTAYRERAREVHPDKNPSPQAAALFHAIKAASEALLDAPARAALDRQLDARAAEAARVGAMDEVRQRLRSELEAREREAAAAAGGRGGGGGGGGGASGGMSELERLRRQGADLRSAYAERLDLERSAAAAALAAAAAAGGGGGGGAAPELDLSMAVRVRWGEELAAGEEGGAAPGQQLSDAHLARAFALVGEVTHVLSRKRCSAVLLFATANGAAGALVAPPAGMATSRVAGGDGGGGGGAGGLKRRRGDSGEGGGSEAQQRSSSSSSSSSAAAVGAAAAQEAPFLEREADVLARVRAQLGGVVGS